MTLFTYLDHKYRSLSLELQKDFTIPKDAELKAAYSLIQYQRSFFKFLSIPILLTKYLLINLHLLRSPILTPLSEVKAEIETLEIESPPETEMH